jgi:surface polysaccharide O-acyltransferase-like enzyme
MEGFYVQGENVVLTTGFIIATTPWFMPLLFVIAGVSSAYALNKKSNAEYLKERIFKLLIPLISGILLVVPVQTYFAERFHNDYTGGYFYQYILFFTKPTDLTGYTGGFTPAHLWFILYLFVISIIALPIMTIYKKRKFDLGKTPLGFLLLLFVVPLLMFPVLDIGGMSVGMYFSYFILGYLFLSNDSVIQKLKRYYLPLLIISIIAMILYVFGWTLWLNDIFKIPNINIFLQFYGWITILAIFGISSSYLNFRNKFTDYLAESSFPVYIFHQSLIVAIAYYVLSFSDNIPLQMILILALSILFTYATYELCRRIPGLRFLFGIKNRTQNQSK